MVDLRGERQRPAMGAGLPARQAHRPDGPVGPAAQARRPREAGLSHEVRRHVPDVVCERVFGPRAPVALAFFPRPSMEIVPRGDPTSFSPWPVQASDSKGVLGVRRPPTMECGVLPWTRELFCLETDWTFPLPSSSVPAIQRASSRSSQLFIGLATPRRASALSTL